VRYINEQRAVDAITQNVAVTRDARQLRVLEVLLDVNWETYGVGRVLAELLSVAAAKRRTKAGQTKWPLGFQ
jgi:hypothetical protein